MRAGKKSVLARDVLEAVNELEFGEFLPRLEAELQSMAPLFPVNLGSLVPVSQHEILPTLKAFILLIFAL